MPIEIDLRACRTVVINMPEDGVKRDHCVAVCTGLGLPFEIMDAIRCTPGGIGAGLSHIKALRAAAGRLPLLLLEDDIAVSDHYDPILTVPDDADAIWLGASIYGAMSIVDQVGFTHMQLFEEAEHGLLRTHNMLSAHAILYLSERFRLAAIEAMTQDVIEYQRAADCGLAMIQSDFNVYAVRDPLFYQAGHLQAPHKTILEEWTRLTLRPTQVGAHCLIEVDGEPRPVQVVRTARGLEWAWMEKPGDG